jgi:hypothetical protein
MRMSHERRPGSIAGRLQRVNGTVSAAMTEAL